MALSRFVVTATITVAAGAATPGSYGSASTPATAWCELWSATFRVGQVIWADSSAGSNGAQLLYRALSPSLRPFADGQDTAGHAGLAN
jgi:hypothetical protein